MYNTLYVSKVIFLIKHCRFNWIIFEIQLHGKHNYYDADDSNLGQMDNLLQFCHCLLNHDICWHVFSPTSAKINVDGRFYIHSFMYNYKCIFLYLAVWFFCVYMYIQYQMVEILLHLIVTETTKEHIKPVRKAEIFSLFGK